MIAYKMRQLDDLNTFWSISKDKDNYLVVVGEGDLICHTVDKNIIRAIDEAMAQYCQLMGSSSTG